MHLPQDQQAWMKRFPMLTQEQEIELIRRYKAGDESAIEPLTAAYMRLVMRQAAVQAKLSKDPRAIWQELLQEGFLGLLEALERYDPQRAWSEAGIEAQGDQPTVHRPTRLATSAMPWIRSHVSEAQNRTRTVVHITKTKNVRCALSNINRARQVLVKKGEPQSADNVERLAGVMNVRPQDVREALRIEGGDVPMDAPSREWEGSTVGDGIADPNASSEDDILDGIEQRRRRGAVFRGLTSLPRRQRMVIVCRSYLPTAMSLEELSEIMGISRERVRQIGDTGYKRLKQTVQGIFARRDHDDVAARAAERSLSEDITIALKGGQALAEVLAREVAEVMKAEAAETGTDDFAGRLAGALVPHAAAEAGISPIADAAGVAQDSAVPEPAVSGAATQPAATHDRAKEARAHPPLVEKALDVSALGELPDRRPRTTTKPPVPFAQPGMPHPAPLRPARVGGRPIWPHGGAPSRDPSLGGPATSRKPGPLLPGFATLPPVPRSSFGSSHQPNSAFAAERAHRRQQLAAAQPFLPFLAPEPQTTAQSRPPPASACPPGRAGPKRPLTLANAAATAARSSGFHARSAAIDRDCRSRVPARRERTAGGMAARHSESASV